MPENEKAAIYCPNCGHLIERHPNEILCLNPEHMRCEWTPEQIRAALRLPPDQALSPGAWQHTCMRPGDEATCQGCIAAAQATSPVRESS